tara:strand:- start:116 stop:442 length:327 start_codon:yes stop_codon:yes gene_type:complete
MRVKEFSAEYEAELRLIPLPKSKSDKIVYFLWLDDQVMELWSEYLNMKCYFGNNIETEPLREKMEKKLILVDYFEMYLDALRLHITYDEIDAWASKNNYWKKYIYNRF